MLSPPFNATNTIEQQRPIEAHSRSGLEEAWRLEEEACPASTSHTEPLLSNNHLTNTKVAFNKDVIEFSRRLSCSFHVASKKAFGVSAILAKKAHLANKCTKGRCTKRTPNSKELRAKKCFPVRTKWCFPSTLFLFLLIAAFSFIVISANSSLDYSNHRWRRNFGSTPSVVEGGGVPSFHHRAHLNFVGSSSAPYLKNFSITRRQAADLDDDRLVPRMMRPKFEVGVFGWVGNEKKMNKCIQSNTNVYKFYTRNDKLFYFTMISNFRKNSGESTASHSHSFSLAHRVGS